MSKTTLTSWALLVWATLEESGYDARTLFLKAGLDPTSLGDGTARYPMNKMHRLWDFVIDATGDPCFGIKVGRHWNATSFHALGFAWLASESLCEALFRLHRYSHIVNDSLQTSVSMNDNRCVLEFSSTEKQHTLHPAAIDAGVAAVVTMCRMLCGQSFHPIEVHIAHANTHCASEMERFMCSPVSYGSDSNHIILDTNFSTRELSTANPELVRINEQAAIQYMESLAESNLADQVKSRIMKLLPSGEVSEDVVAGMLNMSSRTMLRRLNEEGTNYKLLLDETKKELAEKYLLDSQLSINEIAYLVGFTEQANFSRAFRRWYGVSPSKWRDLLGQAD